MRAISIVNTSFPRMRSSSRGRMARRSTTQILRPRSSWLRHVQIFKRSKRLGRNWLTNRYLNSSIKAKRRFVISEPTISSGTKRRTPFFDKYFPAANYAVGVFMAGAGYTVEQSYIIAQVYALANSSNGYNYWSKGRPWFGRVWRDSHRGFWKSQ